jgi:protein TonB
MSTHKLPLSALGGAGSRTHVTTTGSVRENAFLDAMLDMSPSSGSQSQSPLKMAASLVIHGAIIAALLIVPVYFAKNTLILKTLTPTYVFAPPPPAPPPPPAAAARAPVKPTVTPQIKVPTYEAPKVIPKEAPPSAAEAAPQVTDNSAIGGVPGGVAGGILGGVLGGTGTAPGPPPPPVNKVVRVGGDVKAPALVQKVDPAYPAVARVAHVEGTVVISAVIDKTGNVVSEHVVSGPELLAQAALNAVKQWKYQPTYLNGQPVDLAMEVTVNFELGNS